jgi:hypothetical protein
MNENEEDDMVTASPIYSFPARLAGRGFFLFPMLAGSEVTRLERDLLLGDPFPRE